MIRLLRGRRGRRDAEDTPELRLARAREQLRIHEGLAVAVSDPARVLQVVADAVDAATARSRLEEELGLDGPQAVAVLDLQVRRFTRRGLDRVREERDRLREVVAELAQQAE